MSRVEIRDGAIWKKTLDAVARVGSYLHPIFLNKSWKWFQAVAPINHKKDEKNIRFDLLAKISNDVLKRIGDELLDSALAQADAVLLVNSDYQIPLGGTRLDSREIWNRSYGGIFGWLTRSGYALDVADIKQEPDLSRWKAVVYADPGLIGAKEAGKLADFVESGGSLIHIGYPSEADLSGGASPTHRRWLRMFPKRFFGRFRGWTNMVFESGETRYEFRAPPPAFLWELNGNAEVLLRAEVGGAIGSVSPFGKGRAIHIAFDVGKIFNSRRIFKTPPKDFEALDAFAEAVMSRCGVRRGLGR